MQSVTPLMFGSPDGKLNNNFWELDILNIFLKAWIFKRLKNEFVKSEPLKVWKAGKTLQDLHQDG